jgi:hypothetical protein
VEWNQQTQDLAPSSSPLAAYWWVLTAKGISSKHILHPPLTLAAESFLCESYGKTEKGQIIKILMTPLLGIVGRLGEDAFEPTKTHISV